LKFFKDVEKKINMVKIDDADRAEFKSLVAVERKAFLASPISSSTSSILSNRNRRRRRALTVVVRKRPLFDVEKERGLLDVVTAANHKQIQHYGGGGGEEGRLYDQQHGEEDTHTANTIVVHEPKTKYDLSKSISNHAFRFDAVFAESCKTNDVYDRILKPLVRDLDRGAQIAVFAYGQTGSGKTYTMQGLTDMALDDVFRIVLSPNGRARGLAVCISYFEIYCSKVYDLLNDRAPLVLREDGEGIVQVVGLTEHSTRDPRVLRALIDCGANCRSVGTTRVNADSSRSHGVLQLLIREGRQLNSGIGIGGGNRIYNDVVDDSNNNMNDNTDDDIIGNNARLIGKLSLVDLAGSEQASESAPPDSQTHLEAAQINTSLLALKECIRAMGRGQKHMMAAAAAASQKRGGGGGGAASGGGRNAGANRRNSHSSSGKKSHHIPHTHIPFRGSKLTQILRECFTSEGASTVMVTCVSPGHLAAEHTIGSLRYADRLKGIAIRSNQSSSSSAVSPRVDTLGYNDDDEIDDDDDYDDDGRGDNFDAISSGRKNRLSIASSTTYSGKASRSILSENSSGKQSGVLWNKSGEEVWPESAGPKPLSLAMTMMMSKTSQFTSNINENNNNNNMTAGVDAPMRNSSSRSRSSFSLSNNNVNTAAAPPPSHHYSMAPLSQYEFQPNFHSSSSSASLVPPSPPPPHTSSRPQSSSSLSTDVTTAVSKQQQNKRAVATAVATARAASARATSAATMSSRQQPQAREKTSVTAIPASPPPLAPVNQSRVDTGDILIVKSPSKGTKMTRPPFLQQQQQQQEQQQQQLNHNQSKSKEHHQFPRSTSRDMIQGEVQSQMRPSSSSSSSASISPKKSRGKQIDTVATEWKGAITSIQQQQRQRSDNRQEGSNTRSGAITPEWDEELLGSRNIQSSTAIVATSPTPSPRHEGRRGGVASGTLLTSSSSAAATAGPTTVVGSSSLSSSSSSIHKANVVSLLDQQIQELLILREKMTAASSAIAHSSLSSLATAGALSSLSSMSPTSEKNSRVRLYPRNTGHELPYNIGAGQQRSINHHPPPPPPLPFAIHHPQPASPPPMQPPSLSLPYKGHIHQPSFLDEEREGGVSAREETRNSRSLKSRNTGPLPPPPLPSANTARNKITSSSSSLLSISGKEKVLSPERPNRTHTKTTSTSTTASTNQVVYGGSGQDEKPVEQFLHQQGQRQASALRGAPTSSGTIPRPYTSSTSEKSNGRKMATVKQMEQPKITKPSPYAEPLVANFNSSRNRARRGSKASSQSSSVDQSMMSMMLITSPAKPMLRSSFAQEKIAYTGGAGSAAEFRKQRY
jgi:hypothetical protein